MKITLDTSKSAEENAADYYSRARKFKEKAEGARNALEITLKQIAREEKKAEYKALEPAAAKPKVRVKRETEWFERYRWFYTSGGLLAIGGRDASQNEQLFAKQANASEDLFFHAEVHGAPVFILKEGQKKASLQDKQEVAQLAVSYSSAWKNGTGSADAYCLAVENVSKSAKSGEYVAKGGFVMSGKREWFRNTELKIIICLDEKGRVRAYPANYKEKFEKSVMLAPGVKEKGVIAKNLQKILGVDFIDELLLVLPAGKSDAVAAPRPRMDTQTNP